MAGHSIGRLLRSSEFAGLLSAQFLGYLNDNIYKMIVSLLVVAAALRVGMEASYLSLATAVIIMPYILFSGYAGHIADVFSKRSVLICFKVVEIGSMVLALLALLSGRIDALLVTLFFVALHSAFFSPAKYGILSEMLPGAELSRANGLLEMSRYGAVILGTVAGGLLLEIWSNEPLYIGLVLIAIACTGLLASLRIGRVDPSPVRKGFRLNPWAEIGSGIGRLTRDGRLGPTVMALTYFEFLAALVLLDMLLFGKELLSLGDTRTALLGAFVGLGLGVGCFAAGGLSGNRVDLGLVPFGSLGAGLLLMVLALAPHSFMLTAALLVLLGVAGGFFVVPLNAFLQRQAKPGERGRVIATNNFLNMVGVLLACGTLWLVRDVFGLRPDGILLAAGCLTLLLTALGLAILPGLRRRTSRWLPRCRNFVTARWASSPC
ncbi:MAG: MFS transporter [Alphaproteobacteria bacterium]